MSTMFDNYESWMQDRLGKITASEVWKLFEKGRNGDYFGKGANTYIRSKVAEILTLEQVNGGRINGAALEWGNSNEFEAVKRFEKETGLKVDYKGGASPQFFEIDEFSGGSPDGLTNDAIIEIKCPYNSAEHLMHYQLEDAEELFDYAPEYYWQITMNMLACDKKKGYFISYDPRFADDYLQVKIIELPLNEDRLIMLNERLSEAKKQMQLLVELFRK